MHTHHCLLNTPHVLQAFRASQIMSIILPVAQQINEYTCRSFVILSSIPCSPSPSLQTVRYADRWSKTVNLRTRPLYPTKLNNCVIMTRKLGFLTEGLCSWNGKFRVSTLDPQRHSNLKYCGYYGEQKLSNKRRLDIAWNKYSNIVAL